MVVSSAEAFQGPSAQQPGGMPPPFAAQQPATTAAAPPPQIPLRQQVGQLNNAPPPPTPPPFKPTFDGNPHHLAYFLSRIEAYAEQYRHLYPSERSLINAISDGMNVGLASERIAQLYNEHAPELNNVHEVITLLRNRFQDDLIAECETILKTMKQGNKPLKQFVWDFRRVAGNLRHWPEAIVLHYFKDAIDQNIRKACSTRGIPEQTNAWYNVSIALDREFNPLQTQSPTTAPQRPPTRSSPSRPTTPSTFQPSTIIKCYRCGKLGHRASVCLAPTPLPQYRPPTATRPRKPPRKNPNTSRFAKQATDLLTDLPSSNSPADDSTQPENDPMDIVSFPRGDACQAWKPY
ncbi:uncharacterized protein LOC131193133 [Ahaetulla prasina]|uniref:uncharacterized protein LOC131193133 n=1 Tax=Ahaetulla prasina TaxID=499056 RepID=UPI002647DE48|nr:uncharacterized protein LOC131193133 [Ahaetulla prasina]